MGEARTGTAPLELPLWVVVVAAAVVPQLGCTGHDLVHSGHSTHPGGQNDGPLDAHTVCSIHPGGLHGCRVVDLHRQMMKMSLPHTPHSTHPGGLHVCKGERHDVQGSHYAADSDKSPNTHTHNSNKPPTPEPGSPKGRNSRDHSCTRCNNLSNTDSTHWHSTCHCSSQDHSTLPQ